MGRLRLAGLEVIGVQFHPDRPEIEIELGMPEAEFRRKIKPRLDSDKGILALAFAVVDAAPKIAPGSKKDWRRMTPLPGGSSKQREQRMRKRMRKAAKQAGIVRDVMLEAEAPA